MPTTQAHIDIAPKQNTKTCYNCIHFALWGVQYGYCCVHHKDKSSYEGRYCKSFKNNQL